MLRVVRDTSGGLMIDSSRRAGGRGGYLHRAEDCWARFLRRKGMVRSLRAAIDRPARAALVSKLQIGVV